MGVLIQNGMEASAAGTEYAPLPEVVPSVSFDIGLGEGLGDGELIDFDYTTYVECLRDKGMGDTAIASTSVIYRRPSFITNVPLFKINGNYSPDNNKITVRVGRGRKAMDVATRSLAHETQHCVDFSLATSAEREKWLTRAALYNLAQLGGLATEAASLPFYVSDIMDHAGPSDSIGAKVFLAGAALWGIGAAFYRGNPLERDARQAERDFAEIITVGTST